MNALKLFIQFMHTKCGEIQAKRFWFQMAGRVNAWSDGDNKAELKKKSSLELKECIFNRLCREECDSRLFPSSTYLEDRKDSVGPYTRRALLRWLFEAARREKIPSPVAGASTRDESCIPSKNCRVCPSSIVPMPTNLNFCCICFLSLP